MKDEGMVDRNNVDDVAVRLREMVTVDEDAVRESALAARRARLERSHAHLPHNPLILTHPAIVAGQGRLQEQGAAPLTLSPEARVMAPEATAPSRTAEILQPQNAWQPMGRVYEVPLDLQEAWSQDAAFEAEEQDLQRAVAQAPQHEAPVVVDETEAALEDTAAEQDLQAEQAWGLEEGRGSDGVCAAEPDQPWALYAAEATEAWEPLLAPELNDVPLDPLPPELDDANFAAAEPASPLVSAAMIAAETQLLRAMRGMLRVLIEEELNGAMGERVTHNLQQLIRAEVAEALKQQAAKEGAAQD